MHVELDKTFTALDKHGARLTCHGGARAALHFLDVHGRTAADIGTWSIQC